MGRTGGPRRPDKIVALRRREVMFRLATGATMVEIADALRVPYVTIRQDKKYIEKHEAEVIEPDAIKVRTLLVSRLLDIDQWLVDRIKREHRDVKRGKVTTKRGIPVVSKKKQEKQSLEQAMRDTLNAVLNEMVTIEEVKESYLPRIQGEANLVKLRIEIHRIIGSFYGLGTTTIKETHTKETERTVIGQFIMGPKLEEDTWVDAAKGMKEGKIPQLLTEEESRGES